MAQPLSAKLFAGVAACPEKEAFRIGGRALPYAELSRLSGAYVGGLARLGIGRGERVAVFCESNREMIVALFGHLRAGIVHVPINTRYRSAECAHILENSGARVVLVQAGSPQEAELEEVPLKDLGIGKIVTGRPKEAGDRAFDSLLNGSPGEFPKELPADEDAAFLIYTSGTTGRNKGVELSYRAVLSNISALTGLWRWTSADRLVLALPLFHVHGLCIGAMGTLLHRMTALVYPKFDPGAAAGAFQTKGATLFMGVPTMYRMLLDYLQENPGAAGDLARARLFTSGSAPLPAGDFREFEALTGHKILERYGMTETLLTLSNPYEGERRPGSVGLPVPGCEAKLVGDDGEPCPRGEPGELLVRGDCLLTGYWRQPEATAASFRDGWFLTGDVAVQDPDGYFRIVGRKSVDIVKSGGFKISTREIEEVLARCPGVSEVAVVGATDRLWGQKIVAAIVPAPGSELAVLPPAAVLEKLALFAAKDLAEFKKPRGVLVLAELPRNALGKVQKHLLAQQYAAENPS